MGPIHIRINNVFKDSNLLGKTFYYFIMSFFIMYFILFFEKSLLADGVPKTLEKQIIEINDSNYKTIHEVPIGIKSYVYFYFPQKVKEQIRIQKPDLFKASPGGEAWNVTIVPLKKAQVGDSSIITIDLKDLNFSVTFSLKVVDRDSGWAHVDVLVKVSDYILKGFSPEDIGKMLSKTRLELNECVNNKEKTATELIGKWLLTPGAAFDRHDISSPRYRKGDVIIEGMNVSRIGEYSFLLVNIQNKSKKAWTLGKKELSLTGVSKSSDDNSNVITVFSVFEELIVTRGKTVNGILYFKTPDLPDGAGLILILSEAGGNRHLQIEDITW